MPPKKVKEQPTVEKLLLKRIPEPEEPEAFFSIQPPAPFAFPLQEAKIEGVQLIENYYPEEINQKIDESIKTRIERITRQNDKLCVMGRTRGLLIGQKLIEAVGITAFAYGPSYILIAAEDCTLSIYSMDFKPVKQFREFSLQSISLIQIIRTPKDFQGVLFLYSTGYDLVFCRLEKSFFSGLSVKNKKEIITKNPFTITKLLECPSILKSYLTKDASYQDCQLIAILTIRGVNIIRFSAAKITYQKPWDFVFQKKFVKEGLTSVSWGEANIRSVSRQIQGQKLVLAFSTGNTFYMAALQQINQYLDTDVKMKLEWMQSHALTLTNKPGIAFCQCIKKNQILLVTEQNQVIIFHTAGVDLFDKDVDLADINSIQYSFTQRLKGQIVETPARRQLNFKAAEAETELTEQERKQLSQMPLRTYSHSFSYSYGSNEIYFITERQFGIFVYKNWKQICDHLKIEQKFESAMLFLIALYHIENRFDLGLQVPEEAKFNNEVCQYCQILAVDYIKTKLSSLSHMPQLLGRVNLDTILMTPIDFLLRVNQFSFLFQILKQKIIGYRSEDDFYRVLEPFIVHGRVKFIPEQQLRVTFNHYINQGRLDLIQRLAIYFNLAIIDRNLVMQFLLNQKLVVSLAFICTQGNENEFVTPFVKFWGLSENERRNKNYIQASQYALRALWYVKLCLQRNMALRDYSFQKYAHMIEILVINFFTRRMIKSLLEISCQNCLDTLSCSFSIEISGIINQSNKFRLPDVKVHKWIRQRQGNQNTEIMLSGIYDFIREVGMDSEANELFYLMLSRIMIFKTVTFTREKYLEIMTFLIRNYKAISKIKYGLDLEKVKNIEELCSQEEADEILSSEYLSKLLILALQEEPALRNDLPTLFDTSRQVPLTELQANISLHSKNFKSSIEIYLRGRETSKKGIFAFLQNSFRSFQLSKKKSQMSAFASALSDYVPALISLDAKMSRNLIQTYMPEQQEQLIFALSSDERLQLDYLKSIIADTNISDRAMLLYVQLMCKYQPQNLCDSFKAHQHLPIEQSLKVCEKYQAYDCMEYIYERMGNVQKSVEIACSRIDKAFQQRFMYEDAHKAYKIIDDILTNAINTCVKNHTESIWQSLLDAAIELFNKYRQRPEYTDEMFVFYEINAKILYFMVNHSTVDYVIRLFQDKYNKLDMGGSMKQAFIEILSNYSYSQNILFSAHQLTKDVYTSQLINQKNEWLQAFKPNKFCSNCEVMITRTEDAVGFFCGHIYHKECIVETNPLYCVACLTKPNEQLHFYLSIANPQNPKVKIDKLFMEADKKKLEMKEKFKVEDFEESQRNKEEEIHQFDFQSKQKRFRKFDQLYSQAEARNRAIMAELEDKFESRKVF